MDDAIAWHAMLSADFDVAPADMFLLASPTNYDKVTSAFQLPDMTDAEF